MNGRIVKALSGFYYVDSPDGMITCRARGKFRKNNINPLVGDWVEFQKVGNSEGIIDVIFPRKNEFIRPAVSNIDQLIIIAANTIPITDPFLIDRIASIASLKQCEVVLIINKCDIDNAEQLFSIYKDLPFKLIRSSAVTHLGIDEIKSICNGKVSAFTGNSGVGKSSILNALSPDLCIETNEVSQALGRGKHTTRHTEMYKLDNDAYIIDTPGFSSFDSDEVALELKEHLPETFVEFIPFLDQCRYVGCSHTKEKGCAILEEIKKGHIQKSRHDSYLRLFNDLKEIKEWEYRKRS